MKRVAVFFYGVASYAVFFATFLYMIGFVGNVFVPKTLDGEPTAPLGVALGIDLILVLVFGLQHSLMARPGFKQWLTRYIPEPAERPTYVLASSLALIALFVLWQPLGGTIWEAEGTARIALFTLYGLGWLTVLVTTFLINHFDLFGLRQVWLYLRGQEYTSLGFMTPGPYKYVRHPLYVGWLMAFWFTPTMTVTHLAFAIGMSVYILVAIPIEERDLVRFLGDEYSDYKANVPGLIPGVKGKYEAASAQQGA